MTSPGGGDKQQQQTQEFHLQAATLQTSIHFAPATRASLLCFNVGQPEKGNLSAFADGKAAEEMVLVAGAVHPNRKKGWDWRQKVEVVFVSPAQTTVIQ